MKRSLKFLAVGLGVAAIVALAAGTTVFAQGPAGADKPLECSECEGYSFRGEGIACNESIAGIFGLTSEELCDLRQEGLSLADIGADNGFTLEELIQAVITDREEALQALLDEGTITQEQMDYMLERMAERVELMLTRTATGPAEWGMGYNHGKCNAGDETGTGNRWEHQYNSGTCNGEPALARGEGAGSGNQHGKNR